MSLEKAQAIVLRMADFSESSRVVTLFTREFGKLAVVAKGARRLKSAFEAALDLLSVCNIVFIRKSSAGLDILTEAKLAKRFKPRAGDLNSLYAGYYVAELLEALSEEYDAHPLLFDQAVAALDRFAGEDIPPNLSILRFELTILREIGQLPALSECISCGAPLEPGQPAEFRAVHGGLMCLQCRAAGAHSAAAPDDWSSSAGEHDPDLVSPGALQGLRQLAAENDLPWQRLAISPSQLREIRRIVTAAISHVLGRRPRMTRYLQL